MHRVIFDVVAHTNPRFPFGRLEFRAAQRGDRFGEMSGVWAPRIEFEPARFSCGGRLNLKVGARRFGFARLARVHVEDAGNARSRITRTAKLLKGRRRLFFLFSRRGRLDGSGIQLSKS